jgi:hypothetical protein
MTDTTPVGRIVSTLQGAGYRVVPSPLAVAGLKFEFRAVLVGPEGSVDLVLVADTAFDQENRLLQQVEAVARALDIARSTRPLTLVVAGPRPSSRVIEGLSKVCRVLAVGTFGGDSYVAALNNWLAVLLPLEIPETYSGLADPMTQILAKASGLLPEIQSLVQVSANGRVAVQRRIHELIEEPFTTGTNL